MNNIKHFLTVFIFTFIFGFVGLAVVQACVEIPQEPSCEELQNCPTETPTPPVDECDEDKCEEVTPTPTEAPTVQVAVEADRNAPGTAPVCTTALVDKEAINFHVYRKGDQAVLKWWATGGNRATIYYKQVTSPDWQYSVDVDNTGYAEINGLGNLDITFALQQHEGCGAGVLSTPVVDGDTSGWVLFR